MRGREGHSHLRGEPALIGRGWGGGGSIRVTPLESVKVSASTGVVLGGKGRVPGRAREGAWAPFLE